MTRLMGRGFQIVGLRWLRGWGYRGRRPGLIAGAGLLLVVGLDLLLAFRIEAKLPQLAAGPTWFRHALGAAVVAALVVLAGPVLLLTESIRTQGSRLRGALSSLPLTAREIGLITWLPTFAVSLMALVLVWIPAAAVFYGLGFSFGASLLDAFAALLSGYALAALIAGAVRLLLGRSSWATVQYPVMLLVWIGLVVLEMWQTGGGYQSNSLPWSSYVLVVPWLVQAVVRDTVPAALVATVELAGPASIGLLVWSAARAADPQYALVAWRWRRRWRPALVTLELTRLLRSRDVMVNSLGAELIVLGLAFAGFRAPAGFRSGAAEVLIPAIMMVSAIPVVMVRGLTRSAWPVPLTLGYGVASWTASQLAAGMSIAVAIAAPGVIALLAWGVPLTALIGSAVPYGVLSLGFAIATGWIAPASAENPVGQIVAAFLLVFVLTVVEAAAFYFLTAGTPVWFGVLVVLGGLGTASAFAVERRRVFGRTAYATQHE